MKDLSRKYSWVFEIVAVVLILSLGIYILVDKSVILYIVGIAFILFGLVRVVPLIRTTKDKLMKWLFLAEIIIDIAIGAYIIYEGTKDGEMGKAIGYLIGAVLYMRGFLYFFGTVMRKEYSEKMQFVMGTVFISLGAFIIGMGSITANTLRWVIIIIAVAAIIFLGYNAFKGFKNYRNEYAANRETSKINIKEETKEEEDQKEAPENEEIQGTIIEEKDKPQEEVNVQEETNG